MPYQVGDRIITSNDPDKINTSQGFGGLIGEIIEVVETDRYRVVFAGKPSKDPSKGWIITEKSIEGAADPVTDEEVATLFGIGPRPPSEESTLIELLEHVDNGLRNGSKMTRANLAFEFLLKHLELTRLDLPSYVQDMQEDG